jgi:hypothetical protein
MVRTLAETDACTSTSEQLVSVARAYDQMAKCADAIEHSYQEMRRDEEHQGMIIVSTNMLRKVPAVS